MKIISIFLCIVLFNSCTSAPLKVRYYLLHSPENKISNTSKQEKPIVVLQLLDIADYLRQSSLVMQIAQHELHYSREDVWAESLQSSLYKALLQDLNHSALHNYVSSSSPNATYAKVTVNVKVEHFHATDGSTVLSSGRYWLSTNEHPDTKNTNLTKNNHSFFFESDLKQDGYAHAVAQLRTLVANLAQQIEKDITALPNN